MTAFASCQDLAVLQAQIDAIPIEDGSLTKVVAGPNITVTGAGTVANPYVVANSSTVDGSETKVNGAGAATVTGTGTATNPYLITVPVSTGAETKVTAGTNITVTGTGTAADPYVVNGRVYDGSETKVNGSSSVTVTGSGTAGDPYVLVVAAASVAAPGIVELATVAEAQAGTATNLAVTPDGLKAAIDAAIAANNASQLDVFNL
jgi:hypothetical protein